MPRATHTIRSILLTVLFAIVFIPPAQAQLEALAGHRVRLSLQPVPGGVTMTETGVLTTVTADTVALASDGGVRAIPRSYVTGLDISTGLRRQTGRGALIGLGAGAVLLGTLAMVTNDPNACDDGGWFCIEFTTGEAFVIGAIPGGLLGLGIGALAGYTSRVDRWESVDLQLTTFPTARVGPGVPPPGIRLVARF